MPRGAAGRRQRRLARRAQSIDTPGYIHLEIASGEIVTARCEDAVQSAFIAAAVDCAGGDRLVVLPLVTDAATLKLVLSFSALPFPGYRNLAGLRALLANRGALHEKSVFRLVRAANFLDHPWLLRLACHIVADWIIDIATSTDYRHAVARVQRRFGMATPSLSCADEDRAIEENIVPVGDVDWPRADDARTGEYWKLRSGFVCVCGCGWCDKCNRCSSRCFDAGLSCGASPRVLVSAAPNARTLADQLGGVDVLEEVLACINSYELLTEVKCVGCEWRNAGRHVMRRPAWLVANCGVLRLIHMGASDEVVLRRLRMQHLDDVNDSTLLHSAIAAGASETLLMALLDTPRCVAASRHVWVRPRDSLRNGNEGLLPLHWAAMRGAPTPVLERLIAITVASVDDRWRVNHPGRPRPLLIALAHGRCSDEALALLAHHFPPDYFWSLPELLRCSNYGAAERLILEILEADPDRAKSSGESPLPLVVAIQHGCGLRVIEALLTALPGAARTPDDCGDLPIVHARVANVPAEVMQLLEATMRRPGESSMTSAQICARVAQRAKRGSRYAVLRVDVAQDLM